MSSLYQQASNTGGDKENTFGGAKAFQNTGANLNNNQPLWFHNPSRKTIPNHLVSKKKPGFHITPTSTSKDTSKGKNLNVPSDNASQFNLYSFGSSQRKALTSSGTLASGNSIGSLYDTSTGDGSKIEGTNESFAEPFSVDDDLPPSRSIYDFGDDVMHALNKPASPNTDSFINKDPKDFHNAFNKDKDNSDSKNELKHERKSSELSNLLNIASAILVFGYPESMANQVIAQFLNFGRVLEDFEVTKLNTTLLKNFELTSEGSNKGNYPIFCGKSWVKITYDNPSSAMDALQENGSVFNGVLLGVIPYCKDAVEKLQKRKLTESEDVGSAAGPHTSVFDKSEKPESILNKEDDVHNANGTKVDIQDGSRFFLKSNVSENGSSESEEKKNRNLGILSTIFNYLFGFDDL